MQPAGVGEQIGSHRDADRRLIGGDPFCAGAWTSSAAGRASRTRSHSSSSHSRTSSRSGRSATGARQTRRTGRRPLGCGSRTVANRGGRAHPALTSTDPPDQAPPRRPQHRCRRSGRPLLQPWRDRACRSARRDRVHRSARRDHAPRSAPPPRRPPRPRSAPRRSGPASGGSARLGARTAPLPVASFDRRRNTASEPRATSACQGARPRPMPAAERPTRRCPARPGP